MTMAPDRETSHPGVAADDLTWRPLVLNPADSEDARRLMLLRTSGGVWRVHDTIAQQVRDLAAARLCRQQVGPDELAACEREITGGRPLEQYGRWISYPWSGRLVHLLPPAEFRELRLDRNRHKVTRGEQPLLDRFTVGVVGLSVGNAVANTLALEGACGHLRLADFDELSLSNLNRIRASVGDLGLPKTVLAARQILELDPYVSLSLLSGGLSAETIDDFLAGPPPVDAVVDECDDLRLKFLLREVARSRGLPVLMETSDRGMVDVERFDLEPARPLFHGLVGDVTAADIPQRPSMEEKVKLVTTIVGLETLSPGIGASMLEIGETITTWPQLGADVTLGGAVATTAVRRLALGQPLPSGRRYVDIEQALTAEAPAGPAPDPDRVPAREPPLDQRIPELVRFIVAHGILAPSGGNCQPWRFAWDGERLWVIHDRERSANFLDVGHQASYVALGAAIENIRIAAAHRGFATAVEPFPRGGEPTVVAALTLTSDEAIAHSATAALLPRVVRRATNRRVGRRVRLSSAQIAALADACRGLGVHVDLLTDEASLAEAGRIAGMADRIRFLHPALHRELVSELRWSAAAATATGDGIDLAALELSAAEEAALRLIARPDVAAFLRGLEGGAAIAALAEKALTASSAVVLISADGERSADLLRGGQAVERFWLVATSLGVAIQPWTTAPYLVDLLGTDEAAIFSPPERDTLRTLSTRLDRLCPCSVGRPRLVLLRLCIVEQPSVRACRLPIERVLRFGLPTTN